MREMELLDRLLPSYIRGELSYDSLVSNLPTQHVLLSLYGLHLNRLRNYFPTTNIRIFDFDSVVSAGSYDDLLLYLGLENHPYTAAHLNASTDKSPVTDSFRERLDDFFKKHSYHDTTAPSGQHQSVPSEMARRFPAPPSET